MGSGLKTVIKFWARVKTGPGCWLWQGRCDKHGYGQVAFDGHDQGAHRVAWFLVVGSWPARNLCHKCDTPPCVRPDHMVDESQSWNRADCVAKGRGRAPGGESHRSAKLSWEKAREIRRRFANGEPQAFLANEFGVCAQTISCLLREHTWVEPIEEKLWTKIRQRVQLVADQARYRRKLSDADAAEIRRRVAVGDSRITLAHVYGVTPSTVTAVLKNRSHRPLGGVVLTGQSNSSKTCCPLGHEYYVEVRDGRRHRKCRICSKAQMRAAYERRHACGGIVVRPDTGMRVRA